MAIPVPFIVPTYLNANGKPLSGGKLYTYQAGTSTPFATYTDRSGLVANTNPVILDAAGRAPIFLSPGAYKFILKDKDDNTIWTQDNIDASVATGISDGDYSFDGFSSRFSEQFGPTTGLQDTLAKIIKITYTAPTISLGASGSGTVYEKGVAVSSTTLTATVTKRSTAIAEVRFYKVGTGTPISTKTGTIPTGGTETYSYGTAFSDTTQFNAQVDDTVSGSGGPTTVTSNTVTFTFVYPYYNGVGAASLNAAGIQALTKSVITSTATLTKSFTVNGSQKMYFAYPTSYGALTQIFDVNNFDTFGDWTQSTKSFTMADSSSQNYYCYEFNNYAVAGTYSYTFKR